MSSTDFDVEVNSAWQRFAVDLGDRLSELPPGARSDIATDGLGDRAPRIWFSATRGARVRCTIDVRVPRGHDAPELDALDELGFRALAGGERIIEAGRRRVDRVAGSAVRAVREVFNVAHPAFLRPGTPREPSGSEVLPEIAHRPVGADGLQSLVDAAVTQMAGAPVLADADGDLPLPTRAATSWLRVREDEPLVEFFSAPFAHADAVSARELLGHGVRWPRVAICPMGDRIGARMCVEAGVFSADNLRAELAHWFSFVEHGIDQLLSRRRTARPTTTPGSRRRSCRCCTCWTATTG